MPTLLSKFIWLYGRFSALLFLVDVISCKNENAAKQIELILEAQKEKQKAFTPHSIKTDQQGEDILSADNIGQQDDCISSAGDDKSLNGYLKKPDQPPPSFGLEKEITIKAGTAQSIMLEVTGSTKTEGYIIKSVSIKKNSTYYTSAFGATELHKKSIPAAGLPVNLTVHPTQQAGDYTLKLKIGKTGQGSQPTEQSVECTIHVINDKAK